VDMSSKCAIVENKAAGAQAAGEQRGTLAMEALYVTIDQLRCHKQRSRPRRRPKTVDNHIINDFIEC
jgi:hypothetical protein